MERKNNRKNIIIGVLILFLGLSLAYIGYDMFYKNDDIGKENSNNNVNTNNEDGLDELRKLIITANGTKEELMMKFENLYLQNFPKCGFNSIFNYDGTKINDEVISYIVWDYIESTSSDNTNEEVKDENGYIINIFKSKKLISDVNYFLSSVFNIENYKVKEIAPYDNEGRSLVKDGNYYVSGSKGLIFGTSACGFANRVTNISYNSSSLEAKVEFDAFSSDVIGYIEIGKKVATYKYDKNDNKFYLLKIENIENK